ncbi:tetratricopeptide repeat protein [Acinetobacter modestus]|uniref:Outer membrane assembly lipoprotein YfiO n=1 Tax=Acinetobacter modestus TaxID=1776740 RepID=A0ABP2TYP3_9GAMM|nr:hypothetical protein [Acinetobacter modestus]ENU27343.1 hypothetical protein F992_01457 [Acinetobacter modestus]GGA16521.1 hypothetical protein GCM10017554_11440 [Acinetobacter modestus]
MKLQNKFIFKSIVYSSLSFVIYYSPITYAGVEQFCEPNLAINDKNLNGCSNLPVLYPANDSQTNMTLLLSDLGLATIKPMTADPNLWDAVYGMVPFDAANLSSLTQNKMPNQRKLLERNDTVFDERCTSFDSGNQAFNTQVQNNKAIPNLEKQILISERKKMNQCGDKIELIAINPNWSITTRQYASYLNASILFYNSNYSAANKIYTVLTTVEDTWLKETSQYMLIRTSLNSAYATGVDKYGDVYLDNINQNLLKQFLDNINAYLKAYPDGQYVASARGFMRRGFWLSKRQDLLVNEIVWQLKNPTSKFYNLEMSELPAEIDRRVFDSSAFNVNNLKDPFFLAVYDLMHMRESSSDNYRPISWTQLNTQKELFKTQPELFQYLQAAHLFFVQNKAQEAQNYLPKANAKNSSYLQLSQTFLRGQILEKIGQPQNAEEYWRQQLAQAKDSYQRGLFETALSNHLAIKQDYSAFIGKKAQITQPNLQRNFITQIADTNSLQKLIQSEQSNIDQKQAAIYTLLSKSLVHQQFELFKQSYAFMPKNAMQYKGYNSDNEQLKNKPDFSNFIWNGANITPQLKCSNLETLVNQLAQTPKDPLLNVCLGEYFRSEQGYSLQQLSYNEKQTSNFSGKIFARGQIYQDLIKSSSKSDLQAYALYRAIQCYAPSGINDCGGNEVNKTVRKQWFDQIKTDYPNTSWAKSLKYYW